MRARNLKDSLLQMPYLKQTSFQRLFDRISSIHSNCLDVSLHSSFSLAFTCRNILVAIHFVHKLVYSSRLCMKIAT